MLLSLQIRNFALIENINMEFGEGLNILTGETGAGKSILVQALELLLGGRGSLDLIREGEEETEVTGFFTKGEEEISLRRVLLRGGKSRAYLSERPVPVAVLEEAGLGLIDLAGQHEHQGLLRRESHLDCLDQFAGLVPQAAAYREEVSRYRKVFGELEAIRVRVRETHEREEFLRFQMKELIEAAIGPGEEERLQTEREVLKNAVRLGEICHTGEEALESGEGAATERIVRVAREVGQAARIDPALGAIASRLESLVGEIQESVRQLRHYGGRLAFDPERLQEVEDRLALIGRLKKKYGGSLEALALKEEEIRREIGWLDHCEDDLRSRENDLREMKGRLSESAQSLSEKRKKAAAGLGREMERELKDLGMSAARFKVRFGEAAGLGEGCSFGENGAEEVEFLIAPNPGEGDRPLAKVASGGELSRIFLALKKVLGGGRPEQTSVFDEVDAGIGGRVAEVVGRNLAALAKKKQVICITHLPQIACYGSLHFAIQKRVQRGRTYTEVQKLAAGAREEEIARMLAGIRITDQAVAHAREMLKNSRP